MSRSPFGKFVRALRLIPWLVRMADVSLTERWRSASFTLPGQDIRVLVYDLCDGKTKIARLDGKRWFDDNGRECCHCQAKVLWRYFHGPYDAPWNDQTHAGETTEPGSLE